MNADRSNFNQYPDAPKQRMRGFSLTELSVAVAITAVLAGTAVPAIGNLVADARQRQIATTFSDSLRLARRTAATSGSEVIVCPYTPDNTCGNDWSAGWVVARHSAQHMQPVRIHALLNKQVEIHANRTQLLFDPLKRDTNGSIVFCDQRGADHALTVVLSYTGKTRLVTRDKYDAVPEGLCG